MELQLNIFSLLLIGSGLLTLGLAIVIYKRTEALNWFVALMTVTAVWAIAYGMELASGSLSQMVAWVNVEYIGIALIPAIWIMFVIKFIGRDYWLTPLRVAAIFFIPVLTLLFVWTNPYHHLQYQSLSVDNQGPFPLLVIKENVWYWIHTVFFYIMNGWGVYLLAININKADKLYRQQTIAILAGTTLPWVANMVYLAGFRPFRHIDVTPFLFIIITISVGAGMLWFKLFDLIPIARQNVVEAMQEGVLVIDAKSRIVDANAVMKGIIRPFKKKFIGSLLDDINITTEKLSVILSGFNKTKAEIKITEGATYQYYNITLTPVVAKNGSTEGYILLFSNITERKRDDEKLRALNGLKDRLFSIISHDLRSPLNSLTSMLNLANDGMLTEEEFRQMIGELTKNLDYTTSLVNNLLYWAKSQLEGEVLHPAIFDLHASIDSITNLFHKIATDKGVLITQNLPGDLKVYADKDMIQAVIRNLVSNAIKYTSAGGEITISCKKDTSFTTISIADNGTGIKEESLKRLFGMDNVSTPGTLNEKGTGLGLILCKDFIQKNGGSIWAESKRGKGSTFYFCLPNTPPM